MDKMTQEVMEWMDGELPPEQASEVARKVVSDLEYASAQASLSRVTASLKAPDLSLDRAFTSRVAAQVRSQGRWPLWSFGERLLSHLTLRVGRLHPIVALVESRASRARRELPSLLFIACLFGLPPFFIQDQSTDLTVLVFLTVQALGLLVALPWFYFKTDVSVLKSLRQGRCLEDLLCAGVRAEGLVDTLAVHSLRSIVKVAIPSVAVILPSIWLLLPGKYVASALTIALGFVPSVALVFWVGSYLAQFQMAWSHRGESISLAQAGLSLALGLPLLGLLQLAAYQIGLTHYVEGVAVALVALVLMTAGSRFLACWGLANARTVDRWNDSGLTRAAYRNPAVTIESENPIVLREQARCAGAIPQGMLGYGLARMGLPLLGLGFFLGAQSTGWFWGLLSALVVGLWFYGVWKTLPSVVSERERNTWETLLQSGIDRRTFVQGWMEVATGHLGSSLLFVALVPALVYLHGVPLVARGRFDGLTVLVFVLAGALLYLAPLSGAQAGLRLSAQSSTRREAGAELVATFWKTLIGWLLLWGGLTFGLDLAVFGFDVRVQAWAWEGLVQCVLPLLSLLLIGLGGWWGNSRFLKSGFGLLQSSAPASSSVRGARRLLRLPFQLSLVTLSLALSLPLSWIWGWRFLGWESLILGLVVVILTFGFVGRSLRNLSGPHAQALALLAGMLSGASAWWMLSMKEAELIYYGADLTPVFGDSWFWAGSLTGLLASLVLVSLDRRCGCQAARGNLARVGTVMMLYPLLTFGLMNSHSERFFPETLRRAIVNPSYHDSMAPWIPVFSPEEYSVDQYLTLNEARFLRPVVEDQHLPQFSNNELVRLRDLTDETRRAYSAAHLALRERVSLLWEVNILRAYRAPYRSDDYFGPLYGSGYASLADIDRELVRRGLTP